jgi:cytoskeletal protein RodZ
MEPKGSFGPRLRQERERRQISLKSIATNTKIGQSLLEGLERDDVSKWPSGIFRRSFIRSYAIAIGMNPDEVVREFNERFPDPSLPPPEPPAPEPVAAEPSMSVRSERTVAVPPAPDRVELVFRISVPRSLAAWVSWLTSRVGAIPGRQNT